jgi:putative colanic acid biosynthesis glycosyltransferase
MSSDICLNQAYSTTRHLIRPADSAATHSRHARCGGLRADGYGKSSLRGRPLVTVVTVVLNDAVGLQKTIASVTSQTYDNIEFILIDGGSSDATLEVIRGCQDRIDFWISEPDRGIYDAMNKGVASATGDWVIFLNAGDCFYRPDTVAAVFRMNCLDADFIYGDTFFLGGDFHGVVKAWDFSQLWKTMVFTHQSLFTKASLLKTRKFDTSFRICADYDIIFSSYMEGRKFVYADMVIATFDPGYSDVNRALMAIEKWRVVRRYRRGWKVHLFYSGLVLRRFFHDLLKRRQRRLAQRLKRL